MNTIAISLIIPVYNAENFLPNLLGKLERQIQNEVEVILVDDGSNDSSYEICCEYAQNNPNFIIFHQKNNGVSAARNQGIVLAKGKYIAFIDSDDDISDDYVSTLYDLCNGTKADIIQLDAYIGTPTEGYNLIKKCLHEGKMETEVYCNFVLAQKTNAPWDKIYKSEIIFQNSICFDNSMVVGEDVSFTLDVLKNSYTILISHKAIYYYLQNPNGLSSSVSLDSLNELEKLFYNMKKFISVKKLGSKSHYAMNQSMLRSLFRTISLCISNGYSKGEIKQKLETMINLLELANLSYKELQDKIRSLLIRKRYYFLISKCVDVKNFYTDPFR